MGIPPGPVALSGFNFLKSRWMSLALKTTVSSVFDGVTSKSGRSRILCMLQLTFGSLAKLFGPGVAAGYSREFWIGVCREGS